MCSAGARPHNARSLYHAILSSPVAMRNPVRPGFVERALSLWSWYVTAIPLTFILLVPLGVCQQKTPQGADAVYQHGMAALRQGDLQSARAAFEEAARLAPNSPEAHTSLGWTLLSQGSLDDAIAQFKLALRLKPNYLEAHINLANALARKGDLLNAEAEAREALRLDSNSSEAHRTLGRVLSFRGDLAAAT